MTAGLYVAVVAAMRLAFVGFGTDHIPGLFLSFAATLLLGVVGPVIYTVRIRGGALRDLGIRWDNWRSTVMLAVLFATVQFAITLWGYSLPAPVDWVPLLFMALVVGVFESVFFRGFIQNRLEAHFGPRGGVGGAGTRARAALRRRRPLSSTFTSCAPEPLAVADRAPAIPTAASRRWRRIRPVRLVHGRAASSWPQDVSQPPC